MLIYEHTHFFECCQKNFGKIILGYNLSLMTSEFTGSMLSTQRAAHYKIHRQRLWIAQNGKCHWCGKQCTLKGLGGDKHQFTTDHVIPLSANGTNHWMNEVGSCYICNNSRNSKWEHVRLIQFENKEMVEV